MGHPYIFDFPISLYFNLKTLPFKKAYKLPFRISYQTKLCNLKKGVIDIKGEIHHNMIHLGAVGVEGVTGFRKNYFRIGNPGECSVTFKGFAKLAQGAMISVDHGQLQFGNHFGANDNLYLSCNHKITFDDHTSVGWCVNIMDTDNHTITDSLGHKNFPEEIYVGKHVWVTSYCHLLKGTYIPDDCVVAYHSLVNKKFEHTHSLVGGHPAKLLKENITWENNAIYETPPADVL